MANTYTWNIKNLQYLTSCNLSGTTLNNVVVKVEWDLIGVSTDGLSGTFNGATPFETSAINLSAFTPYNSLTKDTVISWLQNVVVGTYQAHVYEQIQKQIDAKSVTLSAAGADSLPWVMS